jgi:hypothetical protein
MIEVDGNLIFGAGNFPAGTDGATICRVSPGGEITIELQLDEQGVFDMHLHDGKIYVCGCDPTESWSLGNMYIRDTDGSWVKRRTQPLTIHTWGACHDASGDLWVACGCHAGDNATWEGRVMRSTDDGITWDDNWLINGYRCFDVIEHNSLIYATGWHWSQQTGYLAQTWRYDGEWIELPAKPWRFPRLIAHGDLLLAYVDNLSSYLVDLVTAVQYSAPSRLYGFNTLCSVGDHLYVLAADGYIWRATDLATWERYSYVANAISLGYWPSQNCLVVSDRGSQAKLWRIPL